jgi:hypothetical protein
MGAGENDYEIERGQDIVLLSQKEFWRGTGGDWHFTIGFDRP